jgi:hypothetical protein
MPVVLDFLETSPQNPARPPSWRWRRAVDLADRGLIGGDDGWVNRGVEFLTRLRDCRDDTDHDRVARQFPDVAAAHALFTSGYRLTRGGLEGRLLAGLTDDEVAATCGLTAAAVGAYHALFFDLRGGLSAPNWVALHAIGSKVFDGLTEADADVILRRAGFLCGAGMVDLLLRYYRDGCRVPARLEDLTREELTDLRDRLQARAVVLGWALPPGEVHKAARLDRLVHELTEVINRRPTGPAAGIRHGVEALTGGRPAA